MADLYEVLLVDAGRTRHAGFLVDDETETDMLLREGRVVPLVASRAALEAYASSRDLELEDDLPDEVDLDLDGWLLSGDPAPLLPDVLALWQLLLDDPDASPSLAGEQLSEAYDDLAEEAVDWFAHHGRTARPALRQAVAGLRRALEPRG